MLELTENKELLIEEQTKVFMITMSAGRGCAVLCREKEERKAQACQQVNVNFKKEWNRKKR